MDKITIENHRANEKHPIKDLSPIERLRENVHIWIEHVTKQRLSDRVHFIAWLIDNFTAGELACIIDSEISRAGVYQTYLNAKFPTGESQCEEQGS